MHWNVVLEFYRYYVQLRLTYPYFSELKSSEVYNNDAASGISRTSTLNEIPQFSEVNTKTIKASTRKNASGELKSNPVTKFNTISGNLEGLRLITISL